MVRNVSLRSATLDEVKRSVEAVLATSVKTTVFDMRTWEPVDEVLIMTGAELPSQNPLVDSHPQLSGRISVEDVRGSVREMRIEGEQLLGRLFFATDPPSQLAWDKVRQGHVTDVSPGIQALDQVRIPAGQTANVGATQYTASAERPLYVTTRWRPREVSLVPIGADPAAKIREAPTFIFQKELTMNPKLRKFLESLGLRAEATEAEAKTYYEGLSAADRTRADAAAAVADKPATKSEIGATVAPAAVETIRAAETPEQTRNAERTRIRQVMDLAGEDVPAETVRTAIDKGWDPDRAAREFLAVVRSARQSPVGPAIHSCSHEGDCTRAALGAALMIRGGLDPVRHAAQFVDGSYRPMREAERNANAELLRAADQGWRFRDLSLVDLCREACRLDNRAVPTTRGETIRTAVSGSALSAIFTTNVSAQLMAGYTEAADTTVGWCSDADVPNFQSNERAMMGKFGQLKKLARGKTAEHLDTDDLKEEYKIARYAGQFVVDEQDIIDDRFGAIDQLSPIEMGNSARSLRPDLVYYILLANAALVDTGTLFNTNAITVAGGHANSTTGALAAATLQTAIGLMRKQRIKKRPLNIRPRFLLLPPELAFTADILLASAMRYSSEGDKNPLVDLGITPVFDDRLAVAGVTDPATGTAVAGTATNYFLACRPGENGAKTIEVGYLRGTGRAPQLRSFVLTEGRWGVGWDINMDIGAKALDFRGMVKSTGA
jgi:hypothetical protein